MLSNRVKESERNHDVTWVFQKPKRNWCLQHDELVQATEDVGESVVPDEADDLGVRLGEQTDHPCFRDGWKP